MSPTVGWDQDGVTSGLPCLMDSPGLSLNLRNPLCRWVQRVPRMHLAPSCTSTSQALFKHIYWAVVLSASILGLLEPLQGPEPTTAPSRVQSNRTPGWWLLLSRRDLCYLPRPKEESWCSTPMCPAGHWGPPWSGQRRATPGEPSGWDRETQSPGMVVWGMQVGWNRAGNGLGA